MNIIIYGKNLQLTEAIKSYIEEKIGKIDQYFDAPLTTNIHVNVSIFKGHHCIEINMALSHAYIRAEAVSDDMYKSVDIVEEKLRRQIRKYKTRMNRKQRQVGSNQVDNKIKNDVIHKGDNPGVKKVEWKHRLKLTKPMSVEEAILQMKLYKQNHLYFIDDISNEMRAVYIRDDGEIGLITPSHSDVLHFKVG